MPVLSAPDAKGKAWRQTRCRTIPIFHLFFPLPSQHVCWLFKLILCGKYLREWRQTSDQGVTFLHVHSVSRMFSTVNAEFSRVFRSLLSGDISQCRDCRDEYDPAQVEVNPDHWLQGGSCWGSSAWEETTINMFLLGSLCSMWKLNSAIWWLLRIRWQTQKIIKVIM